MNSIKETKVEFKLWKPVKKTILKIKIDYWPNVFKTFHHKIDKRKGGKKSNQVSKQGQITLNKKNQKRANNFVRR